MLHTKILDLARIQSAHVKILDIEFVAREPSTMEMIRYRELIDEKEGGSRAQGVAYLFEKCVFNPDMTPAFDKEEAAAIACGSSRVAMPLIKALMQWVGEPDLPVKEGEKEPPKDEAHAESSPSS